MLRILCLECRIHFQIAGEGLRDIKGMAVIWSVKVLCELSAFVVALFFWSSISFPRFCSGISHDKRPGGRKHSCCSQIGWSCSKDHVSLYVAHEELSRKSRMGPFCKVCPCWDEIKKMQMLQKLAWPENHFTLRKANSRDRSYWDGDYLNQFSTIVCF